MFVQTKYAHMKPFILSITILLFVNLLKAQDNIILRTGDEIKAKVEEVGIAEIKYKRTDNPTGPLYTIRKSEVLLINYANGTKDVFAQQQTTGNNTPAMHGGNNCPYMKGKGDYNTYRKLGVKGIVGGAIMTGVGVPTLLAGVGLTLSAISSGGSYYNSNSGMWQGNNINYQQLAGGAFFTAAGAVLTVLGPISIKKGIHFRRLAKQMKPTSIGFAPVQDSNLDRYSQTMNQNKFGVTLKF